jgi:hypothetical protein
MFIHHIFHFILKTKRLKSFFFKAPKKDMLSKQLTNTSYKQYDSSTKWSFNVILTQVNNKNKWKIQVAGAISTSYASINLREYRRGNQK